MSTSPTSKEQLAFKAMIDGFFCMIKVQPKPRGTSWAFLDVADPGGRYVALNPESYSTTSCQAEGRLAV